MAGHRPETLRRAAIMREMASLGLTATMIAKILRVNRSLTDWYRMNFGIYFNAQEETHFRRAVRQGYANGIPPSQIAKALGSTENSVKVTASVMGVSWKSDSYRNKRGFLIPEPMREQYRELRSYGLTMEECGWNLGIVPRPKPHRRYETYAGSGSISRY